MTELGELQRWMLDACTAGPGGDAGAGAAAAAAAVVATTGPLSAEQRLGIYARGYLSRLLECLRSEYPALRALAGDEVFDLFAKGYVWARPPTSPSMFDVGAGFADYLEDTRPRPVGPPGSPDAAPAALARLERARVEATRAPGTETDPRHVRIDPIAVMTDPALTVHTPLSLRLLRLDFALADVLAAAERGDSPPVPVPAETHYAVARSRYRVTIHVLRAWQHAFLEACGPEGSGLDAAVRAAADASGMAGDEVWASVFTWLPLAVDTGMATATP